MSTRLTNHFERLSDANLQVTAAGILSSLTGNTAFPDPKPGLASIEAALEAFGTALAQAQDGGKTSIALKNQKREELIDLLYRLADYVQFTAGGDSAKIAGSGFIPAKDHGGAVQLSRIEGVVVEDGPNPGDLALSFHRVQNVRSYQYQYTPDPLTENSEWKGYTGTVSHARFTGLQSGKKYWCRVIAIGANDQSQTSDAVCRIVQ